MEAAANPRSIDAPRRSARRWRRSALWAALVALLVIAQSLLVALTLSHESTRAQDAVDSAAANAAMQVKQLLSRDQQQLQALLWGEPPPERWRADASELLRLRRALLRIEQRDANRSIVTAVDTPFREPLFSHMRRADLNLEPELACATAQRLGTPAFSRSYFVPQASGLGLEVMDLCLPEQRNARAVGYVTGTFSLAALLEEAAGTELARTHELSFVEGDGTRLARAGVPRGAKVYVAERIVDLPNLALQLRVDSAAGRPQLIPNLASALVLGLSLALFGVVLLLARDVRRRARVEAALAEALAFRKAMEDSLVTGLRARDLSGHITYVNPAFCNMVGYAAAELVDCATPPYWPADQAEVYRQRQQERLARPSSLQESREGFETVFVRKNGERFPVVIYEAPLVDGAERHTGWMSAVLDVSAQRRVEELSRQQQERLQATARLATVGEMASLLSHELNQPLAAIASYASGSLNLMDAPGDDADTRDMLRQATQRIAEQAERAGRVIKSVHDFVRRREQVRELLGADRLIDSVMPLVRLQARKSGTVIELDVPAPAPRVLCDRTMVEQVLLNLTRNGIQSMDEHTPPEQRVLRLAVRQVHARWVRVSVADRGRGVPPDVARQLFTPFFTTRSEGMGLGLSLCRTVIEQHGGALDFDNLLAPDGSTCGAEFRFTLPAQTPDEPSPKVSTP
jgi:two-component system, LuxR family, sensor histidine kinase DctS